MAAYYADWWRAVRAQIGTEVRSYWLGVIAAIILAIVAPPIARIAVGSTASKFAADLGENALISVCLLVVVALILFVPAALRAPLTLRDKQSSTIEGLQANLRDANAALMEYEERQKPKLRLRFGFRDAPYFDEVPVTSGSLVGKARIYRGIANESAGDIDNVEVILTSCSLTNRKGIYIHERLGFTGRGATVRIPPGEPVMYADMVQQDQWPDTAGGLLPAFFCYANPGLRIALDRHGFSFSVAVLGGGARDETQFNLIYGSDGTISVTEIPRPRT